MRRHRAFIIISIAVCLAGYLSWALNPQWHGWEEIYKMVSKGDNMPIAGLICSPSSARWRAVDPA